jgi:hypothetical protein
LESSTYQTAIAPPHRGHLLGLDIAGEKNPLRATPVHPFYARRNSNEVAHWIQAGDLRAGEQVETQQGSWADIQSVNPVEGLSVVYNFTVEEDHDYFVGQEGLLVHNELPDGVDPYQLGLWPTEPYDRVAQYGYTPTAAQRASVPPGMEFDHDPPLVQHYYRMDHFKDSTLRKQSVKHTRPASKVDLRLRQRNNGLKGLGYHDIQD